MFDDIDKIEGPSPTPQKPNHNSWKYMNPIQKAGVIGCFSLLAISLFFFDSQSTSAVIITVCSFSFLLFGYVAGSLWKVRHALHFWYSMAFACIVHASLLPIYWRLARGYLQPDSAGKLYGYLGIALVAIETIFLVGLLRRIAMRLHRKYVKSQQGPFAGFNYGE